MTMTDLVEQFEVTVKRETDGNVSERRRDKTKVPRKNSSSQH